MKLNNSKKKFNSIKIIKIKKNYHIKFKKGNIISYDDIKKNHVLIKVSFSNINYKDILMSRGHPGLIKKFPHTPGIDASGIIVFSKSKKFKVNDKVFILAQPLGVEINGGMSEYIEVKDGWVETLPRNITLKEIVTIGTSGFTAFKALKKSFNIISKNLKKPVLITGASGNVGVCLIIILSRIGVLVEVLTSDLKKSSQLRKLGAKKVIYLKKFVKPSNFDLYNEKYSAIFDNLGGDIMFTSLKYLIKGGILVSIGNVLNNISKINVLPLILREVNILGLNTESISKTERKNFIKKFISKDLIKELNRLVKMIKLKNVPSIIKFKKSKSKILRYIIKI